MPYQFITGNYNGSDGSVTAYVRNEKGVRDKLKILGFRPRFYVEEAELTPDHPKLRGIEPGYKGVYGEHLKKLIMQDPTDVGGFHGVGGFRKEFDRHWEADIDFIRRLLVNTGIRSGFEVMTKRKVVNFKDLVPADFSLPPLESFLDIETYSSDRMPDPLRPTQKITCATLWDSKNEKYITILLDYDKGKAVMEKDWTIFKVPHEAQLILLVRKFLKTVMPDVATEWSGFDFDYLVPRAKRFKIDFDCLRGVCIFDLLAGYEKLYKKGSNRLKDVAYDEGLTDEVEPEVDYAWLWDEDRMRLARRNKRHVQWMVELNRKKANGDLIRFYWNLKNYAGVEDLRGTLYHGVLVDTMLLRKYHGKYVLPSRPSRGIKRESKLGGLIKQPPRGLFEDVVVYDFSRYYPNLMIGLLSAMKVDWVKPIIELCKELMDERDRYERLLSKLTINTDEYNASKSVRDSVKYVGEAVIGYFGSESSRLYSKEIFEKVTKTGQKGLRYLEEVAQKLGHRVLYYDTDSLFIPVKTGKERAILRDELNEAAIRFGKEEGVEGELKIKVDRIFKRCVFVGVKKRYAGWTTWEDGKDVDYLHIKGFEHVRRDASLITRRVQREVFDSILRKGIEGLSRYLKGIATSLSVNSSPFIPFTIPKTLSKRFEAYKTKVDYLRGTLYANKYFKFGIKPGDQVRMVYVRRVPGYPSTDVVCFLDEDALPVKLVVDWDRMIERTVKGKVEELLKIAGLGWERVMGARSLTEVF